MRNPINTLRGSALIVAVTVLAVATAGAEGRDATSQIARKLAELTRGTGFNVSGRFSGALTGDIQINGMSYHLSPEAQVYELGRGPLALGEVVSDRFVFLTGSRTRGDALIYSVIIRPATDATDPVLRPTISDGTEPR